MPLPDCQSCGRPLDRIDHVGTEHHVLDNDVYRPINGFEGVASDTDLRCGYCGMPVARQDRAFFYTRWYRVLEIVWNDGKERTR